MPETLNDTSEVRTVDETDIVPKSSSNTSCKSSSIEDSIKDSKPPLPPGWVEKESRSRPGRFYYFNLKTGDTVWTFPTDAAKSPPQKRARSKHGDSSSKRRKGEEVQCFHILAKHTTSRNPKSWRCPDGVTLDIDMAIKKIKGIRDDLEAEKKNGGTSNLQKKFEEIARVESDCSSAKRGGDLGPFGRGKMQKPFEDASFALEVGEMSDIVKTGSGIHIILRVK